ncbi:MAG TPA: SDR family oxidoreductase [Vicinamibacterales bacterium]|jgi:3-oxoacyl-[acyl-carrier protein] reductase|nr:SDR family oxidoreductase [Vicinamibacterales bacterium]
MVAIVTGGSKGIGLGIARAFVARGMQVVISARNERELAKAVDELGGGDRVAAVAADVQRAEDAERLIKETVARFGGLDVLVNNAGLGTFARVADMSIEAWRQVIDTNLTGVFYCCHAAIPELRRRGGGYIVNISSLAGKNSFVGGAAYCASKAGLNAFSEALMQEVRYDNIRVSYVMPGSVATDFGVVDGNDRNSPNDSWKLTPDDVAGVVVDLVTTDSRALASRVEMRPSKPPRK